MSRASILAILIGGSVVLGARQQTPPVFKGGVTLVTVDVSVLDRDGRPVAGLTAGDFDVKLGGKSSPVRTLDYMHVTAEASPAAAPLQAPVAPAGQSRRVVTNGAPPAADSRAFVVLIDDLSYDPIRGKGMFAAAGRFVASLPAADYVGVATSSQSRIVNPTTDRGAVLAALRTTVGEFSDPRTLNGGSGSGPDRGNSNVQHVVSITESYDIDRGDSATLKDVIVRECFLGDTGKIDTNGLQWALANDTCSADVQRIGRRTAALMRQTVARQVQSYLGVIKAMHAAPGIKYLVLLTDGLALHSDTDSLASVARAAAEAGVQVSVLMGEPDIRLSDNAMTSLGSTAPSSSPSVGNPAAARREDDRTFAAGAQALADAAGGTFYRIVGTPDSFFQRVSIASSAVYRLGVELPSDSKPGRDFPLAVTIRRPGMDVRANRHAIAPDLAPAAAAGAAGSGAAPGPAVPIDDQLKAALATGRALYGVPVAVAAALRKTANAATIDVGVSIQIPASVKGPLAMVFGLVNDAGAMTSGRRTLDAAPDGSDFLTSFAMPVAAGHWRLRVAVADAEGHVGALESPIDAQFTPMGPFLASDLLTIWVAGAGRPQFLSLEDVPSAATVLSPWIELYPASGAVLPTGVRVRMTLARAGQTPPAFDRDVTPAADNGALRASVEIPWTSVPAGEYTLSAAVSVGGTSVGTITATIRKK